LYAGVLAERINEARKRADEANQSKGRFLANVSHEMRTPLNGVIAMADLLRETELSGSQNEIVETLSTSAQLLLAQIEDVLDISKIEAGRVAIECRPFDLGELLTSTIGVVMPQARYKGLALLFESPPEIPRYFRGDAHHLRQVLLNLLANAVKFTNSGQIVLRIQVVEARTSQFLVRFEVKDTGIGIPQDKQALIFEAFAQADDSITRTYGGTGLGTTIAKQLVSLMGGEIGVESEVGAGSTFWFEIPLFAVQTSDEQQLVGIDASIQPRSAPVRFYGKSPANVSRLRGASILVAEDNPTNQRVTRLILESGGHSAMIVCNGDEALDALERGRFDLALFDLSMPVLSGIQALKIYRFTAPKAIPVLILSANVTSDIIAECQAAGCAEFIPKPLRASSLLDAIERHLSSASALAPNSLRSDERPALALIDTPVVDPQVIEDLERLSPDPTFVERLVTGFRGDTDRILANIHEALKAQHFEEVKNSAHALKGGAGSVGAIQLMQLASRLEKTNHDTMRLKASGLLEELHRTTKQALSVLEQHLETRRGRAASGDFD
jgi:two-component system sensor histidine kinase RpfC